MPRFVTTAKAARLAGVPTKEIQSKIDRQQLASTRGKIHIDDLVECYPDVRAEEADMVSLVAKIKAEAFVAGVAKQHREMTRDELMQVLNKTKVCADYYRERSHKVEEMILQLRNNLQEFYSQMGKSQRIEGLIHWLDQRLKEIRRND